jgi:putative holliday junction resolvase
VARGRTCALDLGRARIGVAIDDDLGSMAHPRGTLDGHDRKAVLAQLAAMADEQNIVRFVVGLPLRLSGKEGPEAVAARQMAQQIADATGREVELVDERLTTVQADRSLRASGMRGKKRREHIDEAAACAILQSWLDARKARR